MAEKRRHPSNGYTDAESKKPKIPSDLQARLDKAKAIAAAKAKELARPSPANQASPFKAPSSQPQQNGAGGTSLAALKARVASTRPGASSPAPSASTPPPPPPPPPSDQAPQKSGGLSSLEALKARVAATRSLTKQATQPEDDSRPPQRPAVSSHSRPPPPPPPEDESVRANGSSSRGGLNTALHPMLMEGFGAPESRSKSRLPSARHPTVAGNRGELMQWEQPAKKLDITAPSVEEIKKDNPYFDASLSSRAAVPHERRGRQLKFNLKGKFIEQANELRKQAQLAEAKARIAAETRRQAMLEDKSEQNFLVKDVPTLEWWDEALVHGDEYPDFENDAHNAEQKLKIDAPDSAITNLIQHPVLLEPPFDSIPTKGVPMFMTKEEQKKARRQNRTADLKEKQAKIRLGLQEPDPPKIKKSNLMRVLGEQAVKDPTAVEARVNREIEERREKHEETNEERALSKDERKEKNSEKAKADAAKGLMQTVFRIGSLAYGKHRSKIDMNAKQYHDLTGIIITNPNCCCVVVEAGQHTQRAMKKLLLNRIDWTENAPSTAPALDLKGNAKPTLPPWLRAEDENGDAKDLSENSCVLVWEGEAKQRSFKYWGQRDCETDGAARQVMEKNKMESAWSMARHWGGATD